MSYANFLLALSVPQGPTGCDKKAFCIEHLHAWCSTWQLLRQKAQWPGTVRIMCRPSLQHFPTVIELSPLDPSGAIRMIYRLQENPWRARHFLGVTILISTEAKCMALSILISFKKKETSKLRVLAPLITKHWEMRSLYLFVHPS